MCRLRHISCELFARHRQAPHEPQADCGTDREPRQQIADDIWEVLNDFRRLGIPVSVVTYEALVYETEHALGALCFYAVAAFIIARHVRSRRTVSPIF